MDSALSYANVTVVWLGIISVGQAVVGNSAVVRIVAPPLHAQTAETTDFLIADNSLLGKVPWNSKLFNWIVWMPFLIFALQITPTKNLTDSAVWTMTPLSLTKWCQHFYNNFKKSLRNIVNFLNLKCLLLHKNDSWAQTSLNFAKTFSKISLKCLFKLKRRKKHCKLLKTCLTPR